MTIKGEQYIPENFEVTRVVLKGKELEVDVPLVWPMKFKNALHIFLTGIFDEELYLVGKGGFVLLNTCEHRGCFYLGRFSVT